MEVKIAAGIMSGTSLDGVDVVIAKIKGYDYNTKIKVLAAKTYEWPKALKEKILNSMDLEKSNVQLISSLNYEISNYYVELVKDLMKKSNIKKLDFVASHGQTIWHQPSDYGQYKKSSLQIGEGSILSEGLETTAITNFRAADIAAGGQGAPLVPFVDELLFSGDDKTIALHNLGGISNTTILFSKKLKKDNIAFDTGPANMMIDYAMKKLYQKEYDDEGKIASKGKLIKSLYNEVMSFDYFDIEPPKSTGRELFGNQLTDKLIEQYKNNSKEDIIHTLTMITIDSIVNSYKKIMDDKVIIDEIVFSGGGAHNKFILEKIEEKMSNTKVVTIEDYGMSIDFKEAIAFIILGNQTINFKPANALFATGAKKAAILGQVNYFYDDKGE